MKKKTFFFIGVILLLVVVLSTVWLIKINKNPNAYGDIIIPNPKQDVDHDNGKGLVYYALDKNEKTSLLNSINIVVPIFTQDKNEILVLDDQYNLVAYNIKNQSTTILEKNFTFEGLSIIPDKFEISYINGKGIELFNIQSRKKFLLTLPELTRKEQWIRGYSWSNQGDTLLYSNGETIFTFDTVSKKYIRFFDGFEPVYSNSNKLICFKRDRTTLVVKDMGTMKEWIYEGESIHHKFSPDDKFIAFETQSETTLSKGRDLIIWDFQSNKTKTLISDINMNSYGYFDWR